jgi:transcription initiation factor TFIIB
MCGAIAAERLETNEDEPTAETEGRMMVRMGDPVGIGTVAITDMIGNRDWTGRNMGNTYQMYRMKRWHNISSMTQKRKTMQRGLHELKSLKDKMMVSDTIENRAIYLLRKIIDKEIMKGRSYRAVSLACLYIACRDAGAPRMLRNLARMADIKESELSSAIKLVCSELDINLQRYEPEDLINAIISNIAQRYQKHIFKNSMAKSARMSMIAKRAAEHLAEMRKSHEYIGKQPSALAASAVFLACLENGVNITQIQLSFVSKISVVTLRKRIKEMALIVYKEHPEEMEKLNLRMLLND